MQDVVRIEILKLLDNGIIYLISDSQWVSPVYAVPMKAGFTVVENKNKELVQIRLPTKIHFFIGYRKLNVATRKNHFSLLFIDLILECLAGYEYYYFLNSYWGYNQILIALEDQEKTTFTCPFETFAYRRIPFGFCNAAATFQRCMIILFSDMLVQFLEIFIDDFSIYGVHSTNVFIT